jgi:Zn-finger nucleic acid-binding protein
MAELTCPVCDAPLDEAGRTSRCLLCEGAWVAEDVLVAILEQRASTLVELPWAARQDKPRPCAECKAEMQTVNLGSVALDRCEKHGVWFDANELTQLLKQVKRFKTVDESQEHKEGLLRRLAKLFGG